MSAAEEYLQIVGRLTEAAASLRATHEKRIDELRRAFPALDAAVRDAQVRAERTRFGVDLAWERALEQLWAESWLKLRPRPDADPRATRADLDALDASVFEAVEALEAAVRRRRFQFRR